MYAPPASSLKPPTYGGDISPARFMHALDATAAPNLPQVMFVHGHS